MLQLPLEVELLEDRTLLSAGDTLATALATAGSLKPFGADFTAHLSDFLATNKDVKIWSVNLGPRDQLSATIDTRPYGGALDSFVRIYKLSAGIPVEVASNDNYQGLDPHLNFQTPTDDTYFIVVASSGDHGDPTVLQSGTGNSSGAFDLDLLVKHLAAPLADLQATQFEVLDPATNAPRPQNAFTLGEKVRIAYTIENHGAKDFNGFTLPNIYGSPTNATLNGSGSDLNLSTSNFVPVLPSPIAAGGSFSGTVDVVLPSVTPFPTQLAPLYVGFNLGSSPSPEHGNDWEAVRLLPKSTAVEPNEVYQTAPNEDPTRIDFNQSLNPGPAPSLLNSAIIGTITPPRSAANPAGDSYDFYRFDLPSTGRVRVGVDFPGAQHNQAFPVRLTLINGNGQILAQSDNLTPGQRAALDQQVRNDQTSFYVEVEGLNGAAGNYTLATLFDQGDLQPDRGGDYSPPGGGSGSNLISGDFNGDGIPDLAVVHPFDTDPTVPNRNSVYVYLGLGNGTFQVPVAYPLPVLPLPDSNPIDLVVGDFTGDGRLDLAVYCAGRNLGEQPFVRIYRGVGDGTFNAVQDIVLAANSTDPARSSRALAAGTIVAGAFTTAGVLDLAVVNRFAEQVSILGKTNGSGTFTNQATLDFNTPPNAPHYQPRTLEVTDVNGDGLPDLVVLTNDDTTDKSNLLQLVNAPSAPGQFGNPLGPKVPVVPLTGYVVGIVAGDFNNDGHADLALITDQADLSNQFNADQVHVLLADPVHGGYTTTTYMAASGPSNLVTGDFNNDGHLDLASAQRATGDVVVLLNQGDATFPLHSPIITMNATNGSIAAGLLASDLDNDHRVDLVTMLAHGRPTPLLGHGDGNFTSFIPNSTGNTPYAIITPDLNGDGNPDLVTADRTSDDISVEIGNGDGTFKSAVNYPVGSAPSAVLASDLNRDGRLDLAVLNRGTVATDGSSLTPPTVSILIGNGDGTFQQAVAYQLALSAGQPRIVLATAVAAADFTGDSAADLAVTVIEQVGTAYQSAVYVLINRGDGKFTLSASGIPPQPVSTSIVVDSFGIPTFVPLGFDSIVAGDFTGTGFNDLAVADQESGNVLLYAKNGSAGFALASTTPVVATPTGLGDPLVPNDFTLASYHLVGSTTLNLAVATSTNGVVTLRNTGSGSFTLQQISSAGVVAQQIVVGYPANSAFAQLAAVTFDPMNASALKLYSIDAAGASSVITEDFELGINSLAVGLADFNRDGKLDIAATRGYDDGVSIFFGTGNTSASSEPLASFNSVSPAPVAAPPLLATFGGKPAVLTLTQQGDLFLRFGPDANGQFSTPLVVNPTAATAPVDHHGRDVALVHAGSQTLIAVLTQTGDRVDVYSVDGSGRSALVQTLVVPQDPNSNARFVTRLAAGPIYREFAGYDDLALLDSFNGDVLLFASDGAGRLGLREIPNESHGSGPSGLALADVDNNGRPDLVITNYASGDVTVLFHDNFGAFTPQTFRAGDGLFSMIPNNTNNTVFAHQGTRGLAVGDFNNDGIPDLVALNTTANSFALVLGQKPPLSGLSNPIVTPLPFSPTAVAAGTFVTGHTVNGLPVLDLAVLTVDPQTGVGSIAIYLNDGGGQFSQLRNVDGQEHDTLNAGINPTGLTLANVLGHADGTVDLVVGNQFGDVLIITGTGTGGFRPFVAPGNGVSLITGNFNGAGKMDAITANAQSNQVQLFDRQAATPVAGQSSFSNAGSVVQTGSNVQVIGPGNVITVPVTDATGTYTYAVFANTGSNSVVVNLLDATGATVRSTAYSVGTSPVGLTVENFNGSSLPSLIVTNRGSNDLSVLLGGGTAANWALTNGPRLNAGTAPTSTQVGSYTSPGGGAADGVPDLLITHADGTITAIAGIGTGTTGTGFFDDNHPVTLALTAALKQPPKTQVADTPSFVIDIANRIDVLPSLGAFNPNNPGPVQAATIFTPTQPNEILNTITSVVLGGKTTLVVGETLNGVGRIVFLQADASNNFVEQNRILTDPNLRDPSNLEVVASNGGEEIYATSEGDSEPIVFGIDSFDFSGGDGSGGTGGGTGTRGTGGIGGGLGSGATGGFSLQGGDANAPGALSPVFVSNIPLNDLEGDRAGEGGFDGPLSYSATLAIGFSLGGLRNAFSTGASNGGGDQETSIGQIVRIISGLGTALGTETVTGEELVLDAEMRLQQIVGSVLDASFTPIIGSGMPTMVVAELEETVLDTGAALGRVFRALTTGKSSLAGTLDVEGAVAALSELFDASKSAGPVHAPVEPLEQAPLVVTPPTLAPDTIPEPTPPVQTVGEPTRSTAVESPAVRADELPQVVPVANNRLDELDADFAILPFDRASALDDAMFRAAFADVSVADPGNVAIPTLAEAAHEAGDDNPLAAVLLTYAAWHASWQDEQRIKRQKPRKLVTL